MLIETYGVSLYNPETSKAKVNLLSLGILGPNTKPQQVFGFHPTLFSPIKDTQETGISRVKKLLLGFEPFNSTPPQKKTAQKPPRSRNRSRSWHVRDHFQWLQIRHCALDNCTTGCPVWKLGSIPRGFQPTRTSDG